MFEKGWGGPLHGYEVCGSILCSSGKCKHCAFCLNLQRYLNTELEVIRKALCLLELINLLNYCFLYKCCIENRHTSKLSLVMILIQEADVSKFSARSCERWYLMLSQTYLFAYRSHSHIQILASTKILSMWSGQVHSCVTWTATKSSFQILHMSLGFLFIGDELFLEVFCTFQEYQKDRY